VAPLPTVAVSPAVSLRCAAVATGALAPRPVKAYGMSVLSKRSEALAPEASIARCHFGN